MRGECRPSIAHRCAYILPLLFVFVITKANAVDVSWRPKLRIGTRATENLRSSAFNQEAALGSDTGGALVLDAESERWNSKITPAFNIRRFAIGEDADADEYNVRSQHRWAFIEKAIATLNADYIRNSTLSTEITDAGRRNDIVNRDTVNLQPELSFSVDEQTTIGASFLYSDVSFAQLSGSGFVDYSYKYLTGSITRIYSESLTLRASTFASDFRTPDTQGKTFTFGGESGLTYRFSDSLDADFAIGYQRSKTNFVAQQQTGILFTGLDPDTGLPFFNPVFTSIPGQSVSSGPIASASIRKSFQDLRATLDYSRAVSPSSRGAQTISDDILFHLEHKFSPRTVIGFRGGYNMRSVDASIGSAAIGALNRNQVVASTSIAYRLNQEMVLSARYQWAWNQQSGLTQSIYHNSLFVTLSYTGQPKFYRGL